MFAAFTRSVQDRADKILANRGIEQPKLAIKRKKIGEWMILAAIFFVVLELIFDCPVFVKVIIQISYASLMFLGAVLAFDDKEKKN